MKESAIQPSSIQLDHVHVMTPGGQSRYLLRDISCTFQAGKITLVVGKTGAGKSTLLQTAAGLQPPQAGQVLLDNRPMWERGKVSPGVLKQIGYVFQYPEQQLFANTVRAEFAFSLKPYRLAPTEMSHRVDEAMTRMGLDAQLLGRPPLTLSGGQKRRVALATTFATDADWLFLDEPTAGLDGMSTEALLEFLMQWRASKSGGIVIATHDLDAFFPIADEVLVVHEGLVTHATSPRWLCQHPQVLEDARIGLPSCVEAALAMTMQGIPVSPDLYTPDALAACVEESLRGPEKDARTTVEAEDCVRLASIEPVVPVVAQEEVAVTGESFSDATPMGSLHGLDPRAKWICYVLISAAVLLQHQWIGIVCATASVVGLLLFARMSISQAIRAIRPFLWLILLSVGLSGLQLAVHHGTPIWRWFSFSPSLAVVTFRYLYNLLLVMMLGAILAYTTTQLAMKRGLEQGLSALNRVKFPVAAFSLGTSLVLRFVPVILGEVQRFMVIVRARGKSSVRVGRVRFRDLPALVIPLLLSVFQFGEDISLAMEARGYAEVRQRRKGTVTLQMNRADWIAMWFSLLFFLSMFVLTRL